MKENDNLKLRYDNLFVALPEKVWDLVNLTEFICNSYENGSDTNGIGYLPPSIGRLQNLEVLDLSQSHTLEKLPEELGELRSLKELD